MLEPFFDPSSMQFQALLAGAPVVLMCGVLSVLVVVKRLGFVGQGVSHSAFGGVGVAALLAVLLPSALARADLVQFAVVVVFCIAAALGMSAVSNRRTLPTDTAIGMFLVGSMAVGAVLVHVSRTIGRGAPVQSWESILFGSIFLATRAEIVIGWLAAACVLLASWWFRRPLLFWVFDEDSSPAFGVRTRAMRALLMVLLAVSVVVAMKLAGVVLATALLVLPGAIALRISRRLGPVVAISVVSGMLALVLGIAASTRFDWPAGPCMVLALTLMFAAAAGVSSLRRAEGPASAGAAA
ncbi:MAG: metal ABC transporter permease [Phycisphaerales bacterium]|nr:metal ABC transporter permease [Phycisphaerales bacterium]